MKNLLKTDKGLLLLYSTIVGGLSLLCLFFLFFGVYEVSAILGISGFLAFFTLLIMLKSNNEPSEDNGLKTGSFVAFTILRYVLTISGIILSGLLIHFTNADGNKLRFIYLILSIVPNIVSIIMVILKGKEDK